MKLFNFLVFLALQVSQFNCQSVDKHGISLYEKMEEMERHLLEQLGLEFFVNPCPIFFTGNEFSGEITAAEWVRIIFHDAITANIAAGTGGLDASIGFESDRAENIGVAFVNDTLKIFAGFHSAYVSVADVMALGLAVSLIECDPNPRLIGVRVGRIDATGPGPSGVPEPQDLPASQFAAFAQAGFNQTDAIKAIACGHSLGGVHQVNFPDIVPASVINDNNLDGRDSFDSTPGVFDNTGVNEYLNGSGQAGGPLVVGFNATMRSDLRLFSSDGNATIRSMATPDSFRNTCFTIFERFLNTVPASVTLSDVVVPRTWTMPEAHVDILANGNLTYSGTFVWNSATAAKPALVNYQYTTVGGGNTGPKSVVSSNSFPKIPFGTIAQYAFNDTLNSPQITGVSVNGGSYTAPINLNFFVSIRRSAYNSQGSFNGGHQFLLRVALLANLPPAGLSVTLFYSARQEGSLAPTVGVATTPPMGWIATIGQYKIYEAVIEVDATTQSVAGGDGPFLRASYGGVNGPRINGPSIIISCSTVPIQDCPHAIFPEG